MNQDSDLNLWLSLLQNGEQKNDSEEPHGQMSVPASPPSPPKKRKNFDDDSTDNVPTVNYTHPNAASLPFP